MSQPYRVNYPRRLTNAASPLRPGEQRRRWLGRWYSTRTGARSHPTGRGSSPRPWSRWPTGPRACD